MSVSDEKIKRELCAGAETAFWDSSAVSQSNFRPSFVCNDQDAGNRVLVSVENELARCDSFMISVAFITLSGITPLLQTLKELEEKGVHGKILTTDYLNFSEPKALDKLQSLKNIELRLYRTNGEPDENGATSSVGFHTKGWIFQREEIYHIIIGSSNMTARALTVNKEWNTEVSGTADGEMIGDILRQFDTMWSSPATVDYLTCRDAYRTKYEIIREQKRTAARQNVVPIDQYKLKPNAMQTVFTHNLLELVKHGQDKALLISATGTGKTYASAFGLRALHPRRLLFLVHREKIAKQAMDSFKRVFGLRDEKGNERHFALISGNTAYSDQEIRNADFLFATVQSFSRESTFKSFDPLYFSEICIDEAHHIGAPSYQKILDYFHPDLWLGMTASPDTTRFNVYEKFDYNIACEIRLQQALQENLLCPFHYFGITDLMVDGEVIGDTEHADGLRDFNRLVSDKRVDYILKEAAYYGYSGSRVKGIVFCSRTREAEELSEKFNRRGYRTAALTGKDSEETRERILEKLAMDVPEEEVRAVRERAKACVGEQTKTYSVSRPDYIMNHQADDHAVSPTEYYAEGDQGQALYHQRNHQNLSGRVAETGGYPDICDGGRYENSANPHEGNSWRRKDSLNSPDNDVRSLMNGTNPSEDNGYLDYVFAVDVLSEGVDVPEINQVIMLRPTQSAIVFIQQLGRGLRKSEGKDFVVILDFIGNYRSNFLIPIALSGDDTYNKDNIRRYVMEGNRMIPGISTIHFDEISRHRIFSAIDDANFSDVKLIRENYQQLKNKLGRIPALMDFDTYGSMDVERIFDNNSLGSYYCFLKKYEKDYTIRLTPTGEKMIEFISRKLAAGKRPHELLLLQILFAGSRDPMAELENELERRYGIQMNDLSRQSVINVMTNEFPSGTGKATYRECVFLQKRDISTAGTADAGILSSSTPGADLSGNNDIMTTCIPGADSSDDVYGVSDIFAEQLNDGAFRQMVAELADFGLHRYERDYGKRYADTQLTLNQKYTYEDVCRLLNWKQNVVPLNIGGYKYDAETHTFPVFINYEKAEDISATTRYEDHFVDDQTLIAISKSKRTLASSDVQTFLTAKENHIAVHLFVRKNKDDKIAKDYYYLGMMTATGKTRQFVMPGTTADAVEIEWKLDVPVRRDLYDYIVN